jgi:hypothetical protein
MATFKTYIAGPRWAGLKKFLYDLATMTNVELTILDQDKGWVRETVYFKIDGEEFKKGTCISYWWHAL